MEEITFRAVLVGASGVGKKAFAARLAQLRFCQNEERVQVDAGELRQQIRLQLLISEEDGALPHATIPALPDAVIMMYSIDDIASFEAMEPYYQQTATQLPNTLQVMLGNKEDLPNRLVAKDRAMQFAKDRNILFEEISVKHSTNVDGVMLSILTQLLRRRLERVDQEEPRLIPLERPPGQMRRPMPRPYAELFRFLMIAGAVGATVVVVALVGVGFLVKHLITLWFF